VQLDISHDIKKLTKKLDFVQKAQIPFATAKSLTKTGFNVAADTKNPKALRQSADRRFDPKATPFTKRGFRFTKATKKNQKTVIYIMPEQEKYMQFMIQGGTRFPDRNKIMVPTGQIRLNQFGNITKNTIEKIRADRKKFFFGTPKGQPEEPNAIWERYGRSKSHPSGRRIRPLALLTDSAKYKPIFPFKAIVKNVVFSRKGGFADEFRKTLKEAIRSAK